MTPGDTRTRRAQERLTLVAENYRQQVASGSRAPAAAIAGELGVSEGAARNLIHRARQAGLLPATRQGLAKGKAHEPQHVNWSSPWKACRSCHVEWPCSKAAGQREAGDRGDEKGEVLEEFKYAKGEISRNIAVNLKRLRRARGWSVAQVVSWCEQAGANHLTQASLTNIERGIGEESAKRGNREVTAEELFLFADLLRVPIEQLVGRAPCESCGDSPPAGFTCNVCGRG